MEFVDRIEIARARRRRWSAAALVLYVASVLFAGFHESRHGHSVCEHGELTHADHAPARGEFLSARSHERGGDHAAVARTSESSAEAGEHSHDHCTIATPLAREQCSCRSALQLALAPVRDSAGLHAAARALSSCPLLLLAPHHSPPAA